MNLRQKIYEDFLKKDRLPEYRKVLLEAKASGYRMTGILDYYKMVIEGADDKVLINRHDIDTSPKVAAIMFAIEKEVYGQDASATYYFRDSTIDKKLIKEIDEYGYETGYHYEEVANYEKRNKLRSAEKLRDNLMEIRKIFLIDLERFRKETGSASLSVASHGDFINARYKLTNENILKDDETRKRAGILVEAYDESIMKRVNVRHADQKLLSKFSEEVIKSINNNERVIMILTHPRNWKVDIASNIRENWTRLLQDMKYRSKGIGRKID